MEQALRLKPWESHMAEEMKVLKKKFDDVTAELSKEKDSNASMKASMEAQIDNLTTRNGELTRQLAVLQAEVTTLPAPLALIPPPTVGPAGLEELIKQHDALHWYHLMRKCEETIRNLKNEKNQADSTYKKTLEANQAKYKKELEDQKKAHDAEVERKTSIINQLKASSRAGF